MKGHGIVGYNPFTAVKLDPSVRMRIDGGFGFIVFYWLLWKPLDARSSNDARLSPSSLSFCVNRQIHILLMPHSQQNFADSTGYLVPQA